MEKKIIVNLGNRIFTIEEEALVSLQALIATYKEWLNEMKVQDIDPLSDRLEELIAELLHRKEGYGMTVVTAEIVKQLTDDLPTPEKLASIKQENHSQQPDNDANQEQTPPQNEAPHQNQEQAPPRQLYRDMHNRIIGGVAAGLAHYLRTDVTIIRIILIIFGFTFMPIIALYLIAWLLLMPMPENVRNEYAKEKTYNKRLCRIPSKGKIGGVAAGLAEALNCNATWIRLAWILYTFSWLAIFAPFMGIIPWFGGLMIPAYFVLWIILPAQQYNAAAQQAYEQSNNQTGAQTFASTIDDRRPHYTHASSGNSWANRGAGCAIGGCGCLLLFFAVPIIIIVSIIIPFFSFGIDSFNINSAQDAITILSGWIPPHQLWMAICAAGLFFLLPILALCYVMIAHLLHLPRMHPFVKAILCLLWAFSLIFLIYVAAQHLVGFNIFNGNTGAGGLTI